MTSEKQSITTGSRADAGSQLRLILFWTCVLLLTLVPLAFTTTVYRTFTIPKFLILLVGSAVILLMLSLIATGDSVGEALRPLKSKQVALVSFYLIAMAAATFLGVAPLASFFGGYQNGMGLVTRLCFFTCFIGLIVAVGYDEKRLLIIVWAMALAGLFTAAYAVAQFFGRDPFLPSDVYTFNSPGGPVVRVPGTLGHSNYLGNFLLYTTPLAASLALRSHGRARRIALATVALSTAAIIFSGTRGAWLGLAAGAATFAFFEMRRSGEKSAQAKKRLRLGAALAFAIVLLSTLVIISSPASRNIVLRARSFAADGFTGSGRLLLWRDAARMVPAFALTGCGPEGFSRAFLAYKSVELARHAPQINNESSHNSYLDAAISFGLPGAIAYIAMIVYAVSLLLKSRRKASDRQTKSLITGLVSSLAAVAVHNFFIYDQIPTGLYFFAFMALALITSNVIGGEIDAREKPTSEKRPAAFRWAARVMVVVSLAAVAAALWFSLLLAQADAAIKQAFASAATKDFDGLVASGERATRSAEPTGAYDFLFARALALYADSTSVSALRVRAIEMARAHAEKSAPHTLTPESNYVLLAYLALAGGDTEKLREFATEAIRWDPNFSNARWLMAEALLAEGDRDQAVREAELALRLNRGNNEAMSVILRARGEQEFASPRVQGLVERARLLLERDNTARAEELLARAIRSSNGPCPPCHRLLALVYEKTGRYEKAIAEWQTFAREAPDRAAAEQVSARIEALKQK